MTVRYPYIPEEVSPNQLSLILEPEAAAVYCQNMSPQQRAPHCDESQPFTSNNYIVVDVGGGTVDIVAYRVNCAPVPHMEVIQPPTGGAWGGSMVNLEFKKFLEGIIEDKEFSSYVKTADKTTNAKHLGQLNELIYETFELQKTIFGEKQLEKNRKISVHIPFSFLKQYESVLKRNISTREDVKLDDNELRIPYYKVKEFYDPVVDSILKCITEVLESDNAESTKIYIVGGFGGCHYLYDVIRSHFGDEYQYITPEDPDCAVIKGAIFMQMNPQLIQARRVDATYGVRVSIPFIEGTHAEEYRNPVKKPEEQNYQCTNIFSTFIERGDIVLLDDIYMMTYAPQRPYQKRMIVEIYSSSETDVWYVTGLQPPHSTATGLADVQKIGELIVSFPGHNSDEYSDRMVDVMFDFTSTEIQVKGYEHQSQTEVKIVIDFLNF